jgi:hypothetical protein
MAPMAPNSRQGLPPQVQRTLDQQQKAQNQLFQDALTQAGKNLQLNLDDGNRLAGMIEHDLRRVVSTGQAVIEAFQNQPDQAQLRRTREAAEQNYATTLQKQQQRQNLIENGNGLVERPVSFTVPILQAPPNPVAPKQPTLADHQKAMAASRAKGEKELKQMEARVERDSAIGLAASTASLLDSASMKRDFAPVLKQSPTVNVGGKDVPLLMLSPDLVEQLGKGGIDVFALAAQKLSTGGRSVTPKQVAAGYQAFQKAAPGVSKLEVPGPNILNAAVSAFSDIITPELPPAEADKDANYAAKHNPQQGTSQAIANSMAQRTQGKANFDPNQGARTSGKVTPSGVTQGIQRPQVQAKPDNSLEKPFFEARRGSGGNSDEEGLLRNTLASEDPGQIISLSQQLRSPEARAQAQQHLSDLMERRAAQRRAEAEEAAQYPTVSRPSAQELEAQRARDIQQQAINLHPNYHQVAPNGQLSRAEEEDFGTRDQTSDPYTYRGSVPRNVHQPQGREVERGSAEDLLRRAQANESYDAAERRHQEVQKKQLNVQTTGKNSREVTISTQEDQKGKQYFKVNYKVNKDGSIQMETVQAKGFSKEELDRRIERALATIKAENKGKQIVWNPNAGSEAYQRARQMSDAGVGNDGRYNVVNSPDAHTEAQANRRVRVLERGHAVEVDLNTAKLEYQKGAWGLGQPSYAITHADGTTSYVDVDTGQKLLKEKYPMETRDGRRVEPTVKSDGWGDYVEALDPSTGRVEKVRKADIVEGVRLRNAVQNAGDSLGVDHVYQSGDKVKIIDSKTGWVKERRINLQEADRLNAIKREKPQISPQAQKGLQMMQEAGLTGNVEVITGDFGRTYAKDSQGNKLELGRDQEAINAVNQAVKAQQQQPSAGAQNQPQSQPQEEKSAMDHIDEFLDNPFKKLFGN